MQKAYLVFILIHSSVICQEYDKDIFSSKEQTAEEPGPAPRWFGILMRK